MNQDQDDKPIKDSKEYKSLASKIKTMNLFAWIFVVFGGFVLAMGAGLLLSGKHDQLQKIGDFQVELLQVFGVLLVLCLSILHF